MLLCEDVNITYHVQLCNSVQNMFFTCFSSKRAILSDCCMCASSTTTSFHRTSVMLLEIVLQCILNLGLRQRVSKAMSPSLFIVHVCQMLSLFTLKVVSVSKWLCCSFPFRYLFPRQLLIRHFWTPKQQIDFLNIYHDIRKKSHPEILRYLERVIPLISDEGLQWHMTELCAKVFLQLTLVPN